MKCRNVAGIIVVNFPHKVSKWLLKILLEKENTCDCLDSKALVGVNKELMTLRQFSMHFDTIKILILGVCFLKTLFSLTLGFLRVDSGRGVSHYDAQETNDVTSYTLHRNFLSCFGEACVY